MSDQQSLIQPGKAVALPCRTGTLCAWPGAHPLTKFIHTASPATPSHRRAETALRAKAADSGPLMAQRAP